MQLRQTPLCGSIHTDIHLHPALLQLIATKVFECKIHPLGYVGS